MKIRVQQNLEQAWEVWEYEIPDDTCREDLFDLKLSGVELDNGILVDAGSNFTRYSNLEILEP